MARDTERVQGSRDPKSGHLSCRRPLRPGGRDAHGRAMTRRDKSTEPSGLSVQVIALSIACACILFIGVILNSRNVDAPAQGTDPTQAKCERTGIAGRHILCVKKR